jgi:glycosyltransferase involved in cell wall biosynthesis
MGSLLRDAPAPVLAVATCGTLPTEHPADTGDVTEVHLPLRRSFGRLERTRATRVLGALDVLAINGLARRLAAVAADSKAPDASTMALHAVPHTLDYVAVHRVAARLDLPLFLSVHDDPRWALHGRVDRRYALRQFARAWRGACGRFVISEEMGTEMCRRYGEHPYVIVTDGLDGVPSSPRPQGRGRMKVYFMGSAHLSFAGNFQYLLEALAQLRDDGVDASLVIRGDLPFRVNSRNVPIETRPWSPQGFPADDLNGVDMAYLPLPFDRAHEEFVRFSMSTKMVTYLGGGVPILFHGPSHSAAGGLLSRNGAALLAHSLDVRSLVETLRSYDSQGPGVTERALRLARTQFGLSDVRARFWEPILEATARAGDGHTSRRRSARASLPEL